MASHTMLGRVSALTLIVTLSIIGMPLLAHAEGDETPLAPRRLTIQGRPLWQLRTSTPGGFVLTGLPGQDTGAIRGVAVDAGGQPFAEHRVRLTRVFTVGERRAEQVTTSRTDPQGQFSFTELAPSDYEIDVLRGSDVIVSALVALTASMMVVEGLRVTESIGDRVVYSFHDLAQRADPGWTVEVLDRQGNEFTGELLQVSEATLTISVDEDRREFSEGDILRVTRPPRGMSRSKGAWIGAGLGFAGMLALVGACNGSNDTCADELVGGLSSVFLIGAPVAGALVAGRKGEELLFQADGP